MTKQSHFAPRANESIPQLKPEKHEITVIGMTCQNPWSTPNAGENHHFDDLMAGGARLQVDGVCIVIKTFKVATATTRKLLLLNLNAHAADRQLRTHDIVQGTMLKAKMDGWLCAAICRAEWNNVPKVRDNVDLVLCLEAFDMSAGNRFLSLREWIILEDGDNEQAFVQAINRLITN